MEKKKILLVDKYYIAGIALQAMFQEYTILYADNFATTCEYLDDHSSTIILIIFNCDFLETDNWKLLIKKLTTFHTHMRQIAITESSSTQMLLKEFPIHGILKEQIIKEDIVAKLILDVLSG